MERLAENPEPIRILSLCHHGVTESWARKQTLEEVLTKKELDLARVDIQCRGIDPVYKKPDHEGRGQRATIDDLKKADLIFLHAKHQLIFDRVFGVNLRNELQGRGILIVMPGVEDREQITVATGKLHRKSTGRNLGSIEKALEDRRECYWRKVGI